METTYRDHAVVAETADGTTQTFLDLTKERAERLARRLHNRRDYIVAVALHQVSVRRDDNRVTACYWDGFDARPVTQ